MADPTKKDFENLTEALNRVALRLEDGGSISSGQSSIEKDASGVADSTIPGKRGAYKNAIKSVLEQVVGSTQLDKAMALMGEVQALSQPNGPISNMLKIQEQLGGIAGGLGKQLDSGSSIANNYADALFAVNEKLYGADSSVDGLNVSLTNLLGDFPDAIKAFDDLAMGTGSSADGFKILARDVGETKEDFADRVSDMTLEMGVFGKRMGLNTREIGTFVSRQIDLTGKAGTDLLKEAAIASKRVAAVTGDSSKEILNIVEALTEDTRRYGNVSVTEAARIGGALRQLGLDYSELDGMVDQFFSFDSSVQSVSALTSVFGVQLDAMEMMMMANEDQGAMMEYVRDQFLATGKSIDDMGQAEKRLIQQQLGLGSINAVERLFDPDADFAAMDELGTDAELKAGSVKESMEELSTEIRQFGGDFENAMGRTTEQVLNATLASQQKTLAQSTALLQEFFTGVEGQAIDGAEHIKDILKIDDIGASLKQAMGEIDENVVAGITKAFDRIPEVIKDMTVKIEAILREAGLLEGSPSLLGLSMSNGILLAWAQIPAGVKEVSKDMSDESQKIFEAQLTSSETSLGKFSRKLGKLGIEFDDFNTDEKKRILAKFEQTEASMTKIMNANAKNVKERNLSQELQNALENAEKVYGKGTDAFDEQADRLKNHFKASGELMKAALEEFGQGEKGQDQTFKQILAEREIAAAKKEAELSEKETADPSAAQAATKNDAKTVASSQASQRKIEALTSEIAKLTKQMATGKGQEIILKIEADPLTLNLASDKVQAEIARAAIRATEAGFKAGTNEAGIQLTTNLA